VKPVFLNTVGLIAVWDDTDQWHKAANAAYAGIQQGRQPVLTTTLVLIECGNAAARRPYRVDVDDLRQSLTSIDALVTPTDDDMETAWHDYRRGKAGSASIVDHVSFVVMRRLGLSEAFSSDAHFRAAGFRTLFWRGKSSREAHDLPARVGPAHVEAAGLPRRVR
jgi:uncharacterized protein